MKHTIEIDGDQRDIEIKAMDEFLKRYYDIVSKTAFPQTFLRLPGCVFHSAQANRPKEVSHVCI